MPSAANLDWLYHTLGWTLAAAGVALLTWALFWDRSRGRRRCPKCWYSMEGVPGLRCPECGREVGREALLYRTRRKWVWVRVSCFLLGASVAVGPGREVWLNGWSVVPTSVLVRLPSVTHREGLLIEINRRLRDPNLPMVSSGPVRDKPPHWLESKLSASQWTALGTRCLGLFGSPDADASSWAVINIAWSLPTPLDRVPALQAKLAGKDLAERVDAAMCIMLTAHRYNASGNWTQGGEICRANCQSLVPGLVSLLQLSAQDPLLSPYPTVTSFRRNGMSGTPPSLPRPTTTRSVARAAAADALGALGVSDPAAVQALEAAAADSDPWVAFFAKQALRRY